MAGNCTWKLNVPFPTPQLQFKRYEISVTHPIHGHLHSFHDVPRQFRELQSNPDPPLPFGSPKESAICATGRTRLNIYSLFPGRTGAPAGSADVPYGASCKRFVFKDRVRMMPDGAPNSCRPSPLFRNRSENQLLFPQAVLPRHRTIVTIYRVSYVSPCQCVTIAHKALYRCTASLRISSTSTSAASGLPSEREDAAMRLRASSLFMMPSMAS